MKATFRAGSNIAFIKYWGVADPSLNIPLNSSISMTLQDAHTTTTVAWDANDVQEADEVVLNGERLAPVAALRITEHLDRLRALGGVTYRAKVVSENNFPTASGIASSASGFAALTVAGAAALNVDLPRARQSALARMASGSASRSIFGGFVEWQRGTNDEDSHAHQLYPADYWDLRDVVAVVSTAEKETSSAEGHTLALTSPLVDGRTIHVLDWLEDVHDALEARNLDKLGSLIELDALAMHSVMMTSTPGLFYWEPATLELIRCVRRWREREGLAVYFTIDAGPNVHLICEAESVAAVTSRLDEMDIVQQIIVSKPGVGPRRMADHLF